MEPRSQQKKKMCYFHCCATTDKKLKPHLGKLMHKSKPLQRKKKSPIRDGGKPAETCDSTQQIGKWNAECRNLDVGGRKG